MHTCSAVLVPATYVHTHTFMSDPTGTLTSSITRSPLATAGSVGPVPSATPTPVQVGPYPGGSSGTVSLGRYMHTRQAARYNMTFLTESDSGWPGGPSSTPACVPPCEDGLHPGGSNGTEWKGTLALETKCTITHITLCISFSCYSYCWWYLSSSIDCAINYWIQNEAI